MESNDNTIESTTQEQKNEHALTGSSQPHDTNTVDLTSAENENIMGGGDSLITRKRRKTSEVWKDFEEIQLPDGVKKAMCIYCKEKLATGGRGASTSHLKRHSQICIQRRLSISQQKKQATLSFRPSSDSGSNPFIVPGLKFSNEKMREIIAAAIMVHERPFSIVEDQIWIWAFEYANPEFRKVSRKTARSDCLALYEEEKKILKNILKSVSKVSITTDMWKSSHQVAEYMVITGHFVDSNWGLQKRVMNFVKVPAPRRGVDVANAIFKCLKGWGIENKVFSVSVDNASYNDSCLRNLKENLSLSNKLVLGGQLFHVRCCAHILNLLVQDGLNKIRDVIHNVRESVKYINASDARLKSFCEVVELKGLKERKLIIDCPTRWNSTFLMLTTAMRFKHAFADYHEKEPHYSYAPSFEDWEKIEKVCRLLEVFNDATHVISGSEYPTSNLYLVEVHRVKQVLDDAADDYDFFMREMVKPMKEKFDKYWGECNLLMAIASVLDPRTKLDAVEISFPLIYKPESEAKRNVDKVKQALQDLYQEYMDLCKEDSSSISGEVNVDGTVSSEAIEQQRDNKGMQRMLTMVRQRHSVPPTKSELDIYLQDDPYIPSPDSASSFCALEWWKNNSAKFKVLSRMAADILAVPISIVASESTFSAGGRVIDEYRSKLNEESIEILICGGDWLRHKYGLKRKQKETPEQEEIILKT